MKFIALFIQINNENEKSNGLENILLYGLVDSFHLSDALLTIHNYHALVDSIDEERLFFFYKSFYHKQCYNSDLHAPVFLKYQSLEVG